MKLLRFLEYKYPRFLVRSGIWAVPTVSLILLSWWVAPNPAVILTLACAILWPLFCYMDGMDLWFLQKWDEYKNWGGDV